MNTIKPPRLCRGDKIGIVAPSAALRLSDIEPALEHLRELGFRPHLADNALSKTNIYSGSVEERAADFNAMIHNEEIRMLLFGGGEVCNEILPFVDYDALARNPKIIASFSDSTTLLNAITSKCGLVTFYGASVRTFNNPSEYNIRSFERRMMSGDTGYTKNSEWRVLTGGTGEGILTGGYLVNYSAMQHGGYMSLDKNEKYILIIEDHKHFCSPSMVSKWFSHLEQSGIFDRVTGLLFGHYADEESPIIDDILTRIGGRYEIPVVRCEDFGHGPNNAVFPLGARARLDASVPSIEFLESAVV